MTFWDWLATTTLRGWATGGVVVLGGFLTIGVIVLLWMANRDKESSFDAAEMLEDSRGKSSGPQLGYLIYMGVGAWVTLWLTVNDELTPEYLSIVLITFVGGKLGSQFLNKGAGPASSTQTTSTTSTVVGGDPPLENDDPPNPRPKPKPKKEDP